MNQFEETIANELTRIDPELAGLFEVGLQHENELHMAGRGTALGGVVRELSAGVFRSFTREAGLGNLSAEEIEELASKKETLRAKLATMLELPLDHPLVSAWFDRLSSLPDLAHYKHGGTNPEEAQKAFSELKQIVFSQLAGYFETKPQLDALLTKQTPNEEDISRLARSLARPGQRRYFFSRLQEVGWLRPLDSAGYFPNAPELPQDIAPGESLPPWDESSFLLSSASAEPELVAEILLRVHIQNQNPFVWHRITTVALSLPPNVAGRVARHIAAHFDTGDLGMGHDVQSRLVAHVATEDSGSAIVLARALLRMRQAQPDEQGEQHHWRQLRWTVRYLRNHELHRLFDLAMPPLARTAPLETLRLTLDSLRQAIAIASKEGYSAGSDTFVRRLRDAAEPNDDDARTILATASAKIIVGLSESARARDAYRLLSNYGGSDIFRRLQILLFTQHPQEFRQEINELLKTDESTSPGSAATEVSALLRTAFSSSSAEARAAFVARVDGGPDLAAIDGDEAKRMLLREWQATRLRWFHDMLPTDLHQIAESLGLIAEVPSAKQQSLDETGFWVGSVSAGSDRTVTPKQVDDLASMSPESIADFVSAYDPQTAPEFQLGELVFDGLPQALTAFSKARPEMAIEVLRVLSGRPAPIAYVAALIEGLDRHPRAFLELSLVISDLLRQALEWISLEPRRRHDAHSWLAGQIAQSIADSSDRNVWPPEFSTIDKLARVFEALHDHAGKSGADSDEDTRDDSLTARVRDVVGKAMNRPSGRLIKAAVALARWQNRNVTEGRLDQPTADGGLRLALKTIQRLLEESDPEPRRLAESELGRLLPQLHYVARDWVLKRLPELFEGGVEDPLKHPSWASYLVNNPAYDTTFPDLRGWYLRAASFRYERHAKSDSDYSLSRNLGLHVVFAYIFGLVELEDFDQLLEKVFSVLTVDDRSHIYRELFRTVRLDVTTSERLIKLWDWRLKELEELPGSAFTRDECEGLTALIAIPLNGAATKSLSLRTLIGSEGVSDFESQVWQRVTALASEDPVATFPMVESLARAGMKAKHTSFFSLELAAQAIRDCVACGDGSTAARAKRLIHDLGEGGFEEFGRLLE